MINKDTIIKVPIHVAWQIEKTQEMVYILNIKENKFTYFDGLGTDIWKLINENRTIESIVNEITKVYEIDYNTAYKDVEGFIIDLMKKGVVCK